MVWLLANSVQDSCTSVELSDESSAGSTGADFEAQGPQKRHASDGDGERNGNVPVGIAHVGLDSGGQTVSDHADDAEQQAEPHASGGEDEGGEQHSDRRSEQKRDGAALAR